MLLYKYHGAGNDFLLLDNREGTVHLKGNDIRFLCDRHLGIGADGIILLGSGPGVDFTMEFHNPDGSDGMMCGNGGRCIVSFAHDLGLDGFRFRAADGIHVGEILSCKGNVKSIRITMKDVRTYGFYGDAVFMDTGTRHLVVPVQGIDDFDVYGEGKKLRWDSRFAPIGTNVDFTERKEGVVWVRTFEKGVEEETLACGTGIVASALASFLREDGSVSEGRKVRGIHTMRDLLEVGFDTETEDGKTVFTGITLTGPAEYVAKIEI